MTQTWPAAPTLPPANWYPDPSGVAELRYWNGWSWTIHVVVDSRVETRPMPPPPPPAVTPSVEQQWRLPPRAAVIALIGFVVGIGAAVGLELVGELLGLPRLARLLLAQAGLWAGLLGAVYEVSRRFGTGHLIQDFRVRAGWPGVGWGLLMSFAARVAAGIAVAIVIVISRRFAGTNDDDLRAYDTDPIGFVIIALLVVVGAPIVEELFFRGVVQGALLDSIGTAGTIGLQAVLFGLVHFDPLYGLGNVAVVTGIAAAGVIFGITVRLKGLGPSMFAHSFFNLVAVLATLAVA